MILGVETGAVAPPPLRRPHLVYGLAAHGDGVSSIRARPAPNISTCESGQVNSVELMVPSRPAVLRLEQRFGLARPLASSCGAPARSPSCRAVQKSLADHCRLVQTVTMARLLSRAAGSVGMAVPQRSRRHREIGLCVVGAWVIGAEDYALAAHSWTGTARGAKAARRCSRTTSHHLAHGVLGLPHPLRTLARHALLDTIRQSTGRSHSSQSSENGPSGS